MNQINEKEMIAMKFHEKFELDSSKTIFRVFGGWIYYEYAPADYENGSDTAVFVPEVVNVEANVTNHRIPTFPSEVPILPVPPAEAH